MKKFFKLFISALLCITLLFTFASCSSKETKKEKTNIEISRDATSLSAIEDEITKIAYEYCSDSVLTHAAVVYNGEDEVNSQKGTIYYVFCKNDDDKKHGITTTIKYDMASKTVTEVSYEKGKGQFKDDALKPITDETKKILFSSIFDVIKADNSMGNKLKGKGIQLTIEFDYNGFIPSII